MQVLQEQAQREPQVLQEQVPERVLPVPLRRAQVREQLQELLQELLQVLRTSERPVNILGSGLPHIRGGDG